jgi:dipeptidyl aminopeptidase/acylaminoacyl peptidase
MFACALALSLLLLQGAESRREQITSLYARQSQVKSFDQAVLSPDGQHLAWSVGGQIYLVDLRDRTNVRRVNTACFAHDPAWSNSNRGLAFLANCSAEWQDQLFVYDVGGSADPRQVTNLNGYVSHPRWSPDNSSIAVLFVDHASRRPSPMAAENNAVGVIDDLQNTDVQSLAVADVSTGVTRKVTPSNLYIFEYDWRPDGRGFAFTAAPPPGDDNWYIARLYTQDLRGSGSPHLVYEPHWQIALPRWSPDGKSLAFVEGLMSDEGGTGGEIYTVAASGGEPSDLTPGRKSSPSWFTWLSNSRLLFTEFIGGATGISELNVSNARTTQLWHGDETLRATSEETSVSIAHSATDLMTAVIRTSWSMLPEVWAGPIGHWTRITSTNQSTDLPLPKFESVTWKNEGFGVQGWLLYPLNYDPAKRYPMLVAVHGGPAWIATPVWRAPDFDTTLFTNFGYFVFFPNIRGSYGEGEAFTRANRRDWGFGDMRDLLAGIDSVVKRYPVDGSRVGILGWSYGGSTAMMAITQTNRFRAAVAGAGAGNWQSYYGQNAIDKWMIPYFGASVYDDPATYVRSSALSYIKNAKTPTLILVGEKDGEAPPAQSIEFWHALRELAVPTRLVIYAGEGHSFSKESDRIDVTDRTLDWFEQYMPDR